MIKIIFLSFLLVSAGYADGRVPGELEIILEEETLRVVSCESTAAYYRFPGEGEVLQNLSGAGEELDGQIFHGKWVAGRMPGSYALEFDGVRTRVEIGHSGLLAPFSRGGENGGFSVEAWVMPFRGGEGGIVDKSSAGWGRDAPFWLWTTSGRYAGGAGDSTSSASVRSPGEVLPEKWQHVVLTIEEKGRVKLYVDGNLSAERGFALAPADNGKPLLIGCMAPGKFHLAGRIDEVVIYHRTLPADEISRRHSLGEEIVFRALVSDAGRFLEEIEKLLASLGGQSPPPGLKEAADKISRHLSFLSEGAFEKSPPGELEARRAVEKLMRDSDELMWALRLSALLESL